MINVSVQKLIEAFEEAEVFRIPDMSVETECLHRNVYGRLSRDNDVLLSRLSFNTLSLENLGEMQGLYL